MTGVGSEIDAGRSGSSESESEAVSEYSHQFGSLSELLRESLPLPAVSNYTVPSHTHSNIASNALRISDLPPLQKCSTYIILPLPDYSSTVLPVPRLPSPPRRLLRSSSLFLSPFTQMVVASYSPIHEASLVDPALHSQAVLEMLDIKVSRTLIGMSFFLPRLRIARIKRTDLNYSSRIRCRLHSRDSRLRHGQAIHICPGPLKLKALCPCQLPQLCHKRHHQG